MGSENLLNERIINHFLIFTSLREERKMLILKETKVLIKQPDY